MHKPEAPSPVPLPPLAPGDALSAEEAVRHIQSYSRYFFEPQDLVPMVRHAVTSLALKKSLQRMSRSHLIELVTKRPAGWLIVPAEQSAYGAPPVSWWVHDCMRRIEPHYYVAMLSASQHWGSAHYAPQATQVMVSKPRATLTPGKLEVRFFAKSALERTPTELVRGDVSVWRVSTREATLLDLIRHQADIGSIENVFRIAKDFRPELRPAALRAALDALDQAPAAQRLGYVLERVGSSHLARVVEQWLGARRTNLHPLELQVSDGPATLDVPRWNISVTLGRLESLEELVQ